MSRAHGVISSRAVVEHVREHLGVGAARVAAAVALADAHAFEGCKRLDDVETRSDSESVISIGKYFWVCDEGAARAAVCASSAILFAECFPFAEVA